MRPINLQRAVLSSAYQFNISSLHKLISAPLSTKKVKNFGQLSIVSLAQFFSSPNINRMLAIGSLDVLLWL